MISVLYNEASQVDIQGKTELNANGTVTSNGSNYDSNSDSNQKTFSRMPKKQPVDIHFNNVVFQASLGFRKGKQYFADSFRRFKLRNRLIFLT